MKSPMVKCCAPVLIGFLSLTGILLAEPPAIAVVDLEKVFAEHPHTATATEELTKAREASRDAFKEKSDLLKEILQRHQELIRAGNRDEAAKELEAANEAEKVIATLQTTGTRDLEERFRAAKSGILKEIQASIETFNQDGRFALIFDRSSTSSNGLPQVLHAPGAVDITADVITFIKEQAAAAAKETRDKP